MTNSDEPTSATGGRLTLSTLDDLPEKLRVHALAKLLGRTSKEVLAALVELGLPTRSVQSSVDRKTAEQIVAALLRAPDTGGPAVPLAVDDLPEGPGGGVPAPVFGALPAGPTVGDDVAAPASASPPPLAPLFAPPAPVFQPPARRSRRRGGAVAAEETTAGGVEPAPDATRSRDESPVVDDTPELPTDLVDDPADDQADDQADDDTDDGPRRRRRRGRRGRGRGRGGEGDTADSTDEPVDEADEPDDVDQADETENETEGADAEDGEADTADDDADAAGNRRRRRRRRRRGSGDEPAADAADDETDPPNTVVRVRAPRERADDAEGDGVQSVRGSTRLEAKRQRRRDGRDAGRRRVPILSEAEFLARRESVERSMVVRERGDRVEVGVLEDGVLVEHFITGGVGQNGDSLVGNIYLGRVQNVLPSMEAAFVDIGRGRNAVLYAGEVDWDAAGLGGRARRIEQALSSGDSVLVQVTKDPVGHKGARLTTQISLAGRFLVYVPSGGAAGISRKLPDVERKRLKDLLREIVPSEAGVIIRTASEGVTQEALERDVRRLQAQWGVVKEKSEKKGSAKPKAPVLLYEEPDMLVKVIRDQFNEDFSRLVVSGDDAWETVSNYVGHVASELAERLHRHVGPRDVFEEYRIDEQLLKALDRKVWLPSGGTLVIDRTEAMTVVDVNTGKFTGSGGNLEETVTRNNLEAAEEIVRQLRLRDIGGIIVIDFIDMVLEANRDLVLRRLTECLARDRTRHQVAEVTSLGLVQMTRKRVGGGLLEHFSTPCEHCRGRGVIISTEPVTESRSDRDRGERERSDRSGNGDRDRGGNGTGNGESGGRRSRGRGRRDEPSVERPRRLPDAITPDRDDAALDVGAPVPAEETPTGAVEPVTLESARDDVEEVVFERALATARDEHLDAQGAEPARNGAVESVPDILANGAGTTAVNGSAPVSNGARPDAAESEPAAPVSGRGRRRGRVTRTAGAPVASSGEAPAVTVVTVPAAQPAEVLGTPASDAPASDAPAPDASSPVDGPAADHVPAPGTVTPEPAPEPLAPARPRRARRAASRPAGPPAAENASGSGGETGGDPV